jgi:Pectate lyase superfamily protein
VEAVGVSLLFADYDAISVKDSRFAAVGDGATDDTAALQAALDHCFGSAGAPHGTAGVYQNKALYVPPGHYKITAPLTVKYLHGGRIIGAGLRSRTKQRPVRRSPSIRSSSATPLYR